MFKDRFFAGLKPSKTVLFLKIFPQQAIDFWQSFCELGNFCGTALTASRLWRACHSIRLLPLQQAFTLIYQASAHRTKKRTHKVRFSFQLTYWFTRECVRHRYRCNYSDQNRCRYTLVNRRQPPLYQSYKYCQQPHWRPQWNKLPLRYSSQCWW